MSNSTDRSNKKNLNLGLASRAPWWPFDKSCFFGTVRRKVSLAGLQEIKERGLETV